MGPVASPQRPVLALGAALAAAGALAVLLLGPSVPASPDAPPASASSALATRTALPSPTGPAADAPPADAARVEALGGDAAAAYIHEDEEDEELAALNRALLIRANIRSLEQAAAEAEATGALQRADLLRRRADRLGARAEAESLEQ